MVHFEHMDGAEELFLTEEEMSDNQIDRQLDYELRSGDGPPRINLLPELEIKNRAAHYFRLIGRYVDPETGREFPQPQSGEKR